MKNNTQILKPIQSVFQSMFFRMGLMLTFIGIISMQAYSKVPDTIRVGLYQNEPNIYLDENGEPAGIFVELLNEIAKAENWHLVYVTNSWKQNLQNLEKEYIDLMPDVAFNAKRNQRFDFNEETVLSSWSQLYADPELAIFNFRDLEGLRVALLEESVHAAEFSKMMKGLEIPFHVTIVHSFRHGFQLVEKDLADVVISNHFFGDRHYAEYGLEKVPLILNPSKLFFAAKKDRNAHLLKTIDRHLQEWQNTPGSIYYQTLVNYLTSEYPQEKKHTHFWFWGLFGLVVLTLIFTLIYFRKKVLSLKASNDDMYNQYLAELKKTNLFFEKTPTGIFLVDQKGKFLQVNSAASVITGFSKDELLKKNFLDMATQNTYDQALAHLEAVVNGERKAIDYTFFTKQNEEKHLIIDAFPVSDARFAGFAVDITDYARSEAELQQIKSQMQKEMDDKTRELQERIKELEHFHDITVEREIRVKELRDELKRLKNQKS